MTTPTSFIPAGMSDRAAIALLTLRLRTVEKELIDALNADAAIDVETAREQLRAKLVPLEAQRRAALDDAVEQAEVDAAAAVETARRRVAEIRAAHAVATHAEPAMLPTTTEVVEPPAAVLPAATPEPAPVDAPPAAEPAATVPAATVPAATVPAATVPAVVSPQIVFDTEAFARVFATVIAETIEKTRAEIQSQQPSPVVPPVQYSPGMPPVPGMPNVPYGQYPMYYPPLPPRRDGFWSHAKHPDVILLGIATVIVLVILAAWLS